MNLLTDKLSMDDYQLNRARIEIMRNLNLGVEKALQGEADHTHVILLRLDGIWTAFMGQPLGHLAQRDTTLITAAQHHRIGSPYILTDAGRQLTGLTTGEPA